MSISTDDLTIVAIKLGMKILRKKQGVKRDQKLYQIAVARLAQEASTAKQTKRGRKWL